MLEPEGCVPSFLMREVIGTRDAALDRRVSRVFRQRSFTPRQYAVGYLT